MTKQDLYRDLCIEAGTYTGGEMTAAEWYIECSHNIPAGLDATLESAATGDVSALADVQQSCAIPILV